MKKISDFSMCAQRYEISDQSRIAHLSNSLLQRVRIPPIGARQSLKNGMQKSCSF